MLLVGGGRWRARFRFSALGLTALLLSCLPFASLGARGGSAPESETADNGALPEMAFSGTGESGSGGVGFRLGFYHNADEGDGNPFLDERLTVVETVFLAEYAISDRLSSWSILSTDLVSSASIARLSKFPDQSGASGDFYAGLDAGLRYELGADRRVGGHLHVSAEYDYRSLGFGGDYAVDLAEKNTTLSLSVNGFYDFVDLIRFDGKQNEGSDRRVSATTTLGWYQVLDPKTSARLGATFTFQDGFLATPYNAVVLEDPALPPNPNLDNRARGLEYTEVLPRRRYRGAVFGRVRRQLREGSALELGGRYYRDDWALWSTSVEPAFHQTLIPERLSLSLRYRYVHQVGTRHQRDHFFGSLPRYRTQDSDLAGFDSHGVGAGLGWDWSPLLHFDLGGDFVHRSDGLDFGFASVAVSRRFGAADPPRALWRRIWDGVRMRDASDAGGGDPADEAKAKEARP